MKYLTFTRKSVCASFSQVLQVVAVSLGVLLFCIPSFAQSNLGRIYGAITDQSGGAVVGSMVTVIDVARGISRPLVSDGAGQFDASSLIPGEYTVRAEAKGFKIAEHTSIEVGVGKEVRVDLTLQPGEQTTTVTVTGDLPMINTANAQLGGTLEQITISELPVDGRNYQYLAWTRPGVVMTPSEGQNDFSTDGIRVQYVVWMIDGLIDSNLFVGSPSLVGGAQLGPDQATILPLDAIQEVNMIENAGAAYGDKPGAHIDVGLKSGTNSLHGTAYAFGRDTVLNAKNPFLLGSEPKAPLTLEQFGASIGGPIKKDKIFYFANYEAQRYTVGVPKIQQEPTVADISGFPGISTSTANTFSIPDALFGILHTAGAPAPSPLSLNLGGCSALVTGLGGTFTPAGGFSASQITALNGMNQSQLAAGCTGDPQRNIFGSASTPVNGLSPGQIVTDFSTSGGSDNGIIKVDIHANDKNSLNFDWYSGGGNGVSATVAEQYWASDLHTWANLGRAVWIWTPNSTWLNEFRFGYDYGNYPVFVYECDKPVGPNYAALGFTSGAKPCAPESSGPGRNVFGGFPALSITGGFATLGGSNIRQDSFQHYFSILDNVSWTHGKHTVKFGPEIRFAYFNSAALVAADNGSISFGGVAAFSGATPLQDYLTGVPATGSILVGDPNRNTNAPSMGLYIQDDWRVTPRITVNAGIRYEYTWPWSNPSANPGGQPAHLLGNFNPALHTATDLVQEQKGKPLYHMYPWNFDPRLGIAWDVFGNGKTVVHVGASVMHNSAPRGIQVFFSGGALINAVPTGFTFFDAANPTGFAGPGTIASTTIAGSTNTLPWALNTPVFSGIGAGALACGDGVTIPAGKTTPYAPCQLQTINPNFRTGYYITQTLSVQHAFTNNLTIDIAYVGDRGSSLDGAIDSNPPLPGPKNTSANPFIEQARRPYAAQFPFYSRILLSSNSELSNYNSLQVSMTHRLHHGLQVTPGFTWSHSLDNQSVENPLNPMLSYGSSGNPLVFTLTGTYYLPSKKTPGQLLEGWQINSTVYMLHGAPITPTDTSDDLSGTGQNADHWNVAGDPHAFKMGGPGLQIPCYGVVGSSFAGAANCTTVAAVSNMPAVCQSVAAAAPTNPNSFGTPNGTGTLALSHIGCYVVGSTALVPQAQGTFGTEGTGTFYGHGYRNWDFSATKNWKFKERYGLQFRAEFFNILNRTLYNNGGTNLASPSTFGQASTTPDSGNPVIGNGPRKIQFGLKLSF